MRGARRMATGALTAAFAIGLAWAPRAAEACSVCMGGREDENRTAFIVTTVFLSVLPLAMIGGIIFWLRRAVREAEAGKLAARPVAVDAPAVPTPASVQAS